MTITIPEWLVYGALGSVGVVTLLAIGGGLMLWFIRDACGPRF